jgi:hypothetical protein
MPKVDISVTNPFEDTVFLIRAACNERVPAHVKVKNVETILEEFHEVMHKVQDMNIVSLQNWPSGNEE